VPGRERQRVYYKTATDGEKSGYVQQGTLLVFRWAPQAAAEEGKEGRGMGVMMR